MRSNPFVVALVACTFVLTAAALAAPSVNGPALPYVRTQTQIPGHIYVGSTDGFSGAVLSFPIGANGNVAPSSVLAGPNTHICSVTGLAFAGGFEYVGSDGNCNGGSPSVLVFALRAHGNNKAVRVIAGSATTLRSVAGLAVDSLGSVYVTDYAGGPGRTGAIDVFASGASGNVAPIASIYGGGTFLHNPTGIAIDAASNVYVVSLHYPGMVSVLEFAAGANGEVSPIGTLSAPNDSSNIAIGGSTLYVTYGIHHGASGVAEFALPGFEQVGAIINQQLFARPGAVTVDASGNVFVVDFARKHSNNTILRFPPGSNQPSAIIKGSQTGIQDDYPSTAITLGL